MAYEGPHPLPVKSGGTGAATLTGVLTGNGTSAVTASTVTQHGVIIGGASNAVGSTAVGSTGQVLQANSAADPTYSTATFPSTATSTGTILRADGTNWSATTATYPTTTTVSQILYSSSANAIGGITTGNNGLLVTSNSGVPSILAGPGTTGQILQSNSAAAPSFSTASYPSSTTINQILYSSSANVVAGLATANNGVLTTGTGGVPVITAIASNGQLIIGSGSGAPAAATLSAGTGITITNAANSITISASGTGLTWSDQSGTFTAAVSNGYFITTTSTPTLPASPSEGDTVEFIIDTTNTCTITGNTGQKIRLGGTISAAAGTCANNARGDSIALVYRSTGTTWFGKSSIGTWTLT